MLDRTYKLIKPITEYLLGYTLISIPIIVNALTLNLDVNVPWNSTLLALPKGDGKTTLLHEILRKSNPKYFPDLPAKIYETEILQLPDDYFNRKVWIYDDLITLFRGTSTKQREQLMHFHNEFLSKGEYSRANRKAKGKILCLYGIAREEWRKKFAKELFESTFQDRFMIIEYKRSEEEKRWILRRLRERNINKKPPKVELPFSKRLKNPEIPERFKDDIEEIAIEIDKTGRMSYLRAKNVVENFLKSNAVINKRDDVVEEDLMLFKMILPLWFGAETSINIKVREIIIEASINQEELSAKEIYERVRLILNCSEKSVHNVLSELKNQNIVKSDNGKYFLF